MDMIVFSNFILSASAVVLAILLSIEKTRTHEITKIMVARNVALGEQLDILRNEIKALNSELIVLVRENHLLSIEVQTLANEVSKLRNEITSPACDTCEHFPKIVQNPL